MFVDESDCVSILLLLLLFLLFFLYAPAELTDFLPQSVVMPKAIGHPTGLLQIEPASNRIEVQIIGFHS